jgi:hypothetical protein
VQAVSVAMPSGLSRISCSVNSGISTAVTVIVAVAGFFEGGKFQQFFQLQLEKLLKHEDLDFNR